MQETQQTTVDGVSTAKYTSGTKYENSWTTWVSSGSGEQNILLELYWDSFGATDQLLGIQPEQSVTMSGIYADDMQTVLSVWGQPQVIKWFAIAEQYVDCTEQYLNNPEQSCPSMNSPLTVHV